MTIRKAGRDPARTMAASRLALVLTIGLGWLATSGAVAETGKLGQELTPLGAVRAGNESGTIPAWQGGLTDPPAGYTPGMHHPDPFPEDAPLFAITAQTVEQYGNNLSPGQIAMLTRYPDTFRMPVYQTRRSASLPPEVYEKTIANASIAALTEDGNGVRNVTAGIPFPIPENGLQVIWNHLLRYRGQSVLRQIGQATPTAGGSYTMVKLVEEMLWGYNRRDIDSVSLDNKIAYFLQEVTAPARLAGNILLVHETLDQVVEPRTAWIYNPGRRRVRRAPNVAYDNPGTAADGQRTSDQLDMFNGAPDRYDWTLVGKQELYIPYNSYRLHSDQVSFDDILMAGHINPDLTRYELHRVWVVEATLKSGTNHIYPRRVFYLDEDSWQVMIVDQYDGRGELWRVSEAHVINYYEVPLLWDTLFTVYDLQNGRYLASGLDNEYGMYRFDVPLDIGRFTPEALRRRGGR